MVEIKKYEEVSLNEFPAWDGGLDTLEVLKENGDCNEVEEYIEDRAGGEALTEEEVNDILWHEKDEIAEWLGYVDWYDYEVGYEDEEEEEDASELWDYFNNVISWIEGTFNTGKYYRKEMCGLNWGKLYDTYKDNEYDCETLEEKIHSLMENEEVTDKKGIYEYVLSNESEDIARKLSRRAFSNIDKRTAYERQEGICPICGEHCQFEEMEGDHIIPWWRGGKTILENLQMICRKCNGQKGGKMKI